MVRSLRKWTQTRIYFIIALMSFGSIMLFYSGYLYEILSTFIHVFDDVMEIKQEKKIKWTHYFLKCSLFVFIYFCLKLLGTPTTATLLAASCWVDIQCKRKHQNKPYFPEARLCQLFHEVLLSHSAQLDFFSWISLSPLYANIEILNFFFFKIILLIYLERAHTSGGKGRWRQRERISGRCPFECKTCPWGLFPEHLDHDLSRYRYRESAALPTEPGTPNKSAWKDTCIQVKSLTSLFYWGQENLCKELAVEWELAASVFSSCFQV